MNRIVPFLIMMAALVASACGNLGKKGAEPVQDGDSVRMNGIASLGLDSALYGHAGDFGMSSFCLICDGGDTVVVSRDDHTGKMGVYHGYLQPGDRYCMTTTDDGEAMKEVVNLTLLEKFVKDYSISNCRLMLFTPNGMEESAEIVSLDKDSLVVRTSGGIHKYYPL